MISITKTVRCVTKTPDGKEVLKEKEVKMLSAQDMPQKLDERKLSNRDTLIKIPLILSFLAFAVPGTINFLFKSAFIEFTKLQEIAFWVTNAGFEVCAIIYLLRKVR